MAIHRVTMMMTMDGSEQRNVFYTGAPGSGTDDAGEFAIALRDIYDAELSPVLSNQWRLYQATVQDVSAAGLPVIPVSLDDVVGAVSTNDWLPLQVTGVVTFRSFTPKPNRGHKMLGGFTEFAVSQGVFTQVVVDAMTAWAQAIIAQTINFPLLGLALAHYDNDLDRVTAANVPSAFSVNPIPGSLRRRRKGHGI